MKQPMGLFECSISPNLSANTNVVALESSLQQCIINFKELLSEFEQRQVECENYKLQFSNLRKKCDGKICNAAEDLKKAIETKDLIIQSVASSLTKLNDTKDWNVLTETFKILFGDSSSIKDKENQDYKGALKTSPRKDLALKLNTNSDPASKVSPKAQSAPETKPKEEDTSITEDVSFKEETLSEIEGTPTGRTSPIIHTKKTKTVQMKSLDFRDKKKCSEDWPTPESKSIKLTFPAATPYRGKAKLRQSRLNLVRVKQTSVVDLTCSPEFFGGYRSDAVMPLIKKESIENDDTILPSPTSGLTNFTLLKTASKDSPSKFKRPLSLKVKMEKCENQPNCDENRNVPNTNNVGMEDSINILNQLPNRLRNEFKKETVSPVKVDPLMDEDATRCEIDSSMSLLDHVTHAQDNNKSPTKRPLAENINIMNTPPKRDPRSESSPQPESKIAAAETVKRKLPELVEPIYKEPTVRKKAEKRNLQGWSCVQCKNFYGELYKNDAVMLARKINECSKHRGRHNPERPKTPPNFWNPRWEVPTDTEELNRMNNAI